MLPGIYSGSVFSQAKDIFSFTRMYFKDKTKSVIICEICGIFYGCTGYDFRYTHFFMIPF